MNHAILAHLKENLHMQDSRYAVCRYAGMHVCKYASMKTSNYASGQKFRNSVSLLHRECAYFRLVLGHLFTDLCGDQVISY